MQIVNKYGARSVEADGYRFASRAEHRRYEELRLLMQAGEIRSLEVHPRFALYVPVFEDGEFAIDQTNPPQAPELSDGLAAAFTAKLIGHVTADFAYMMPGAAGLIVEDVKSKPTQTTAYRLRKKMVESTYGITVREVLA